MMLEYLLVRPADREGIFANHRCRFLVLDEVHTYRGILGSNIALLTRRLKVHLERGTQNWGTNVGDQEHIHRFPPLVPVGTSATIKSVNEEGLAREQVISIRDQSVQEFFGTLASQRRRQLAAAGIGQRFPHRSGTGQSSTVRLIRRRCSSAATALTIAFK